MVCSWSVQRVCFGSFLHIPVHIYCPWFLPIFLAHWNLYLSSMAFLFAPPWNISSSTAALENIFQNRSSSWSSSKSQLPILRRINYLLRLFVIRQRRRRRQIWSPPNEFVGDSTDSLFSDREFVTCPTTDFWRLLSAIMGQVFSPLFLLWLFLRLTVSDSNEAKSVAGNHWLWLSPSVALLRGQVWSSFGIRCQHQQLVD